MERLESLECLTISLHCHTSPHGYEKSYPASKVAQLYLPRRFSILLGIENNTQHTRGCNSTHCKGSQLSWVSKTIPSTKWGAIISVAKILNPHGYRKQYPSHKRAQFYPQQRFSALMGIENNTQEGEFSGFMEFNKFITVGLERSQQV